MAENKKPAKGEATNVEFSDLPKKNQPMGVAVYESSDENAEALRKALAEAEAKRSEDPAAPNWVDAEDRGTGRLLPPPRESEEEDKDVATINPSDLARKYGALNTGLLRMKGAVNPEAQARNARSSAFKTAMGPEYIAQKSDVSFARDASGNITSIPGPTSSQPVYTEEQKANRARFNQAQRLKATAPRVPVPGTGSDPQKHSEFWTKYHFKAYFPNEKLPATLEETSSRVLAERKRVDDLAEANKDPQMIRDIERHVREGRPLPSQLPTEPEQTQEQKDSYWSEIDATVKAAEAASNAARARNSTQGVVDPKKTREEAAKEADLSGKLPIDHNAEVDPRTGAVKLTPVKQVFSGATLHSSEARTFSPTEPVSADNFTPHRGDYGYGDEASHVIIGNTLHKVFTKKTTTYKRVNNNGVFDVIPSTQEQPGLFYKHPNTGQMIQTNEKPTSLTAFHNANWKKEKEANEEKIGAQLPSNSTYSRFGDAIEKHHEFLFGNYSMIGRYLNDKNKPMLQHTESDTSMRTMEARDEPNKSKEWVSNTLNHLLSVHPMGAAMGKQIEANPDAILPIFAKNRHLLTPELVAQAKEKSYKEAVNKGIVPKRVVPESLEDRPAVTTLWAQGQKTVRERLTGTRPPRIPNPDEATAVVAAAGYPPETPTSEDPRPSRSEAMNLGATEGR